MLKRFFILCCFFVGCYFLSSCTSINDEVLQQRKIGIIQSCYTSLQNGGTVQKIYEYLEKNKEIGHITNDQKNILQECLNRTYKSDKWSK